MSVLVSVVIPFYSNKEWLRESLKSVFDQTFTDFEVIIVNDGSNEDITDVIDLYKGRILYYQQENKGPAAARNLGISKAKGKYIAFEDSDDVWLPTKLEKQISFMEDRRLVWSHTGFYNWWPDENIIKKVNVEREYGDIYFQRFISVKMATPCVAILREFLIKEGLQFPEQYRNGEDGALWTKLSKLQPVGLILEPLTKVRMRKDNSFTHAIERFRLNAISYKIIKESPQDYPKGIIFIKHIYYCYSKIFSGKITPLKNTIAKFFWVMPYCLERLYVKKLAKNTNKDDKYILR